MIQYYERYDDPGVALDGIIVVPHSSTPDQMIRIGYFVIRRGEHLSNFVKHHKTRVVLV